MSLTRFTPTIAIAQNDIIVAEKIHKDSIHNKLITRHWYLHVTIRGHSNEIEIPFTSEEAIDNYLDLLTTHNPTSAEKDSHP